MISDSEGAPHELRVQMAALMLARLQHLLRWLALACLMSVTQAAAMDAACLVVADVASGTVVHREGQSCEERIGPASTFKLPLAVMGFDAGILIDADAPAWPYQARYAAVRSIDRRTTTPRTWIHNSVLWYSRVLVQELGAARFEAYVRAFDYGNADVSGERGAGNGMTHAWLNTSLQISPAEQLHFIQRLLAYDLPVTDKPIARALSLLPTFDAGDGWTLRGKTGTGYLREADGRQTKRQYGWFIGWAENAESRFAFAYLVKDATSGRSAAGPRARDDLISRWRKLHGRSLVDRP